MKYIGSYLLSGLYNKATEKGLDLTKNDPKNWPKLALETVFGKKTWVVATPQNTDIVATEVKLVSRLTGRTIIKEQNLNAFCVSPTLAKGYMANLDDTQFQQLTQFAKEAEVLITKEQLQALASADLDSVAISLKLGKVIDEEQKTQNAVFKKFYYVKDDKGNFLVVASQKERDLFKKIGTQETDLSLREAAVIVAAAASDEKYSTFSDQEINGEVLQNALQHLKLPAGVVDAKTQFKLTMTEKNTKTIYSIRSTHSLSLEPEHIAFLKQFLQSTTQLNNNANNNEVLAQYLGNPNFKLFDDPLFLVANQSNIAKIKEFISDASLRVVPKSKIWAAIQISADAKTHSMADKIKNIIGDTTASVLTAEETDGDRATHVTIPFQYKDRFRSILKEREQNCFVIDSALVNDILYKTKTNDLGKAVKQLVGADNSVFFEAKNGYGIALRNGQQGVNALEACRRQTLDLSPEARAAIVLAAQILAKQRSATVANDFKSCCTYLNIDLECQTDGMLSNTKSITIDGENLAKLNQVVRRFVILDPKAAQAHLDSKDAKGQPLVYAKESKGVVVEAKQFESIHLASIPECYKTTDGEVITEPFVDRNGITFNRNQIAESTDLYFPVPKLATAFDMWKQQSKYVKPESMLIQPLTFKAAPLLSQASNIHLVYNNNHSSNSNSSSSIYTFHS